MSSFVEFLTFVFLSLCSASLLPEPLRVLWCFPGLAKKPFPTFFLANYASQKEEFARNAIQNDGIRRDSPYLHR
ncbi:hypothetical protein HMPREF1016_02388 [Bacteroides eggerthii 1_2_48FAA]|uniref:Uncharacterized protein n=1 Tax=Bacteroides eggerthii 1_2_48FAA TaxID=665953 RepID=E5X0D2_9BACE|nr:hypothetical protein HMPREF1016_02388 [Bacteroides eggerthii 1_2_48FAA]